MKAVAKRLRIEQTEHAGKTVVARQSILEFQELPKKLFLLPSEQRHVPCILPAAVSLPRALKATSFPALDECAMNLFLHGTPGPERRLPLVVGAILLGRLCRRLGIALTRIGGRNFLGMALVSVGLDFAAFDSFTVPTEDEVHQVSAAVVFTGAFERVDAGLQLMAAGAVPRLYVSGVNAGAGILPAHFVGQFSARNQNIADLRRLVECCVEWGERADNTFQNAWDTKCWVDRRGLTGALLLITSQRHMARALAALSGALPHLKLIPYPVDEASSPTDSLRQRALEYVKFLGTIVAVRLRWVDYANRLDGPFAKTCPGTL